MSFRAFGLGAFWSLSLLACGRAATSTTEVAQAGALAPTACEGPDDRSVPVFDPNQGGRLRGHIDGTLADGPENRQWIGAPVPDYVDTRVNLAELFLLDRTASGHLAFYREPYNVGACPLGSASNCPTIARHYGSMGELEWEVALSEHMSRPTQLEVQDIRFVGETLYFNEACQSYASGADGQCSSLVAVDPIARRTLWRTEPLTSNGRFSVVGCYLVTGYGFTAEPDFLKLVRRHDGAVVQTLPMASAPNGFSLDGERLDVALYAHAPRSYRMQGLDGGQGQLVPLDPAGEFGGAAYGGAGYGGLGYGGLGYGGQGW